MDTIVLGTAQQVGDISKLILRHLAYGNLFQRPTRQLGILRFYAFSTASKDDVFEKQTNCK